MFSKRAFLLLWICTALAAGGGINHFMASSRNETSCVSEAGTSSLHSYSALAHQWWYRLEQTNELSQEGMAQEKLLFSTNGSNTRYEIQAFTDDGKNAALCPRDTVTRYTITMMLEGKDETVDTLNSAQITEMLNLAGTLTGSRTLSEELATEEFQSDLLSAWSEQVAPGPILLTHEDETLDGTKTWNEWFLLERTVDGNWQMTINRQFPQV